MFSIALVVFRESLEIALILGVVLAATKEVAGKAKWVWAGIAGGVAGSALVAFFINEISDFAEGVGQEIFNAVILITAALVIGWTVLWMRSHAKQMTQKIKQVGKDVQEGKVHMAAISLVIGLAFLREGSEIALFGNGILLSGKVSTSSFITGALIGLVSGSAIGALMYLGMIKISTKHVFQVTSWLLIFLAAGMMSIAASYLVSAGVFNSLTDQLWDTSAILSDSSVLGQIMGVLIGYTATPMQIQLIFYLATLTVLATSTKMLDKKLATSSK